MNIGIWHNLPSGGGKRALYDHAAGLASRGHRVTAWCPPTADQGFLPLSKIGEERILPLGDMSSLCARRSSGISELRRLSLLLRSMRDHCASCAQEMIDRQIEVLLGGSCRYFRTSPIGRSFPGRSIIYLNEPNRKFFEFPFGGLGYRYQQSQESTWRIQLKNFVRSTIHSQMTGTIMRAELENARGFDQILVNSIFSRESVLRAYGLEAEVCYLGVNTNFWRPITQEKKDYV